LWTERTTPSNRSHEKIHPELCTSGEDNGSNNPLIGTLNLTTGLITPFATGGNPKGMLFVP
jgi:hypothetical protein